MIVIELETGYYYKNPHLTYDGLTHYYTGDLVWKTKLYNDNRLSFNFGTTVNITEALLINEPVIDDCVKSAYPNLKVREVKIELI